MALCLWIVPRVYYKIKGDIYDYMRLLLRLFKNCFCWILVKSR